EDGPYLPSIGNTHFAAEALGRAADWFTNTDPVRTHSLICRLLDTKLIDRYLSRHRVAALTPMVMTDLTACARLALDQAEPVAGSPGFGPDAASIRDRAGDRLEGAAALLSRLAVRFTPDEAASFLPRVLALFRSDAVRGSVRLPEVVGELLETTLATMRPADVGARLLDVIQLPCPGTAELAARRPSGWPSLLSGLPDVRGPAECQSPDEAV